MKVLLLNKDENIVANEKLFIMSNISPFAKMFSKVVCCKCVGMCQQVGKGLKKSIMTFKFFFTSDCGLAFDHEQIALNVTFPHHLLSVVCQQSFGTHDHQVTTCKG